ncbi:unnamed protein product, partial [Acanthocheilonema viteae]
MVLSDNATQFQLVFQIIRKQNANFLAKEGIVWKNTIPKAPWGGGLYERLIGLTKQALKQAIGRKLLKEKEFITLIAQIEALLNTRPLTYAGVEDYCILRPIDFISPTFPLWIPRNEENGDYSPYPLKTKDKVIECWNNILNTLDVFWKRWRDEYLSSLRERTQKEITFPRSVETRRPTINKIVLLAEPNIPRGIWKLAKIINLKRGQDGCVRSATIPMPNGKHLDRPINQLCPLEINESDKVEDKQPIAKLEDEQPIAQRTRRATQQATLPEHKSTTFTKAFFLMAVISLMITQAKAIRN